MSQPFNISVFLFLFALLTSCQKEIQINSSSFHPTPLIIDLPSNFPPIDHPEENPLTEEGVNLGRHLFWETKLSGNNTISLQIVIFLNTPLLNLTALVQVFMEIWAQETLWYYRT